MDSLLPWPVSEEPWTDVIWRIFVDVTCAAVANEGVEIHQWLRDEQARQRGRCS